MSLNLVTVVGNNCLILPHMLDYYKKIVDNIYIILYITSNEDKVLEEVEKLGIVPYRVVRRPKFKWNEVTNLYNQTKREKPNDWWIVSDQDEIQLYPKPIKEMIEECEENGWEFITGGFLDRLGKDGEFPIINYEESIWNQFPLGGFFRHPLSGACPNKVCVMKGNVKITSGQHYVDLGNGKTNWGDDGLNHPKRYPVDKGFVQVHHFKWDSTSLKRLKEVADTKKSYTYWEEYGRMYGSLKNNKLNIYDKSFMFENVTNKFSDYKNWETLKNKIIQL